MSTRVKLTLILALALAARALACYKLISYGPNHTIPDIDNYESMAESLARTGQILDAKGQPSALREPGYPLLLSFLYRVTGPSLPAALALNCVLGVLTVAALYALGLLMFGERVALWAAALAAVHPQLIFYATQLRRESLLVLLTLLAALAAVRAYRSGNRLDYLLAGLAAALGPLANSPLLAGSGLAGLILWRIGVKDTPFPMKPRIALFFAGLFALYGLWPARNFLVFGRLIPGVVGGGNHMYLGIAVPNDAAGTPEEAKYVLADPVTANSAALPDDFARDQYFYRAAWRWISEHPGGYAKLALQSGLKLWRLVPYERAFGYNYRLVWWASALSDGWIIPLGLMGLLLARGTPEAALLNAMMAGTTFAYMLFWSIVRYRLPLMPFVILYAASAADYLATWKARMR